MRLFCRADLTLVAYFSCSANPVQESRWEKDVNDWIKAEQGGALTAIAVNGMRVWLYQAEDGRLIGYGSLGTELLVLESGAKVTICLIPYFGIATEFQGLPVEPKEARFARRILWGLIELVRQEGRYPDLYLYVDPENPAWQRFYPKFGFEEFDRLIEDGREWIMMRKSLVP